MQRVMKIIGPLRVQAHPARPFRSDNSSVVEIALCNHMHTTAEAVTRSVGFIGDLLENVSSRSIENRVNGIQAKTIHVKLLHPVECVFDKVPPHLVRLRVIVVDRAAPRRVIGVGEVRSILPQVIAFGS